MWRSRIISVLRSGASPMASPTRASRWTAKNIWFLPMMGATRLLSNQPGLQFYSGNFFDGSTIGKAGKSYYKGDAIALEPQMFPDAPNQASFASVALHPYMMYENMIIWQFGATAPNADEHLPQ